jgi:hypothetical protein
VSERHGPGERHAPGELNVEAIQSRIVDRIITGLRGHGAAQAAGYRQSDGKNYGEYGRADQAFHPEEVEKLARRIATEEAARIQREIRPGG